MIITIWTLTTYTDYGLQTSVHLSELDCYRRLIERWFPIGEPECEQDREASLIALSEGIEGANSPIIRWFEAYFEADEGSGNIASIDFHNVEIPA